MSDLIQSFDDNTAQKILSRIVKAQPAAPGKATSFSPELKHALMEAFDQHPSPAASVEKVSSGELAKLTLQVLAEDQKNARTIEIMASAEDGNQQTFDLGASFALTAAVIFALQTRIQFERDSTGKWSVKIDKKASSDSALKSLVQKLLAFTK